MNAVLFILAQAFIPWYLANAPAPQPASQKEQAAIDVSILLPFNGTEGVNGNMVDFYNGALLAAKELGQTGQPMNIRAIDISSGVKDIVPGDITIGPISGTDIISCCGLIGKGCHLISPLEPRAGALIDSLAIVQVPSPVESQIADNARWVAEDFIAGDQIYVICPPDSLFTNRSQQLLDEMENTATRFKKSNLTSATAEIAGSALENVSFRILIAAENEYFVSSVLREMSATSLLGKKIVVYFQSRLRSYENLKTEFLHNCNLHMSSSSFVDYSSDNTRKFVENYRTLFDAEPNSFAFRGYDCLHYFAEIRIKYGESWFDKLPAHETAGLQSNFRFVTNEKAGRINSAVKRVIYNPDFSITVQ